MTYTCNKNSNFSMGKCCCVLWCIAFCAAFFSTQLFASTDKKSGFDQLISVADLVVLGHCTSVQSEWRKKKIYTIATIKIDEVIKGKVVSGIQIEYMGGRALHPVLKAPVSMNVSNGITISEGDEAVFILKKLSNQYYQVIGATRGNITVATDAVTGDKNILIGARKIKAKSSDKGDVVSNEVMSLQDFLDYIRSRIKLGETRQLQ